MNHLDSVSLTEKFAQFDETFKPRRVAHLNGQVVKLVKAQGEFVWHHHEQEDELFFVHSGAITIQYRDRDVLIKAGEFHVVPKGVEHCPKADELCEIVLFEPDNVVNTGSAADSDMTVDEEPFI